MLRDKDIDEARRWFAEDIKEAAPVVHNNKIVDAFSTVPREDYLGNGPWNIHSRLSIGRAHISASSDPRHLYHDVLVSIIEASGINNGMPSLWAMVFDNLNIKPGATVLQIGAGVGYYTAILAELVTDKGRVIAYEVEEDLAKRAQNNLRHYPHVDVIFGDATQMEELPDFDVIIACAGVTHVPERWLEKLSDGGQMVLPLTGESQWGFLLHLERNGDDLPVKSLGPCGFYHCLGARLVEEEKALALAFKSGGSGNPNIGHYHLGQPPAQKERAWVIGKSYWISKASS
ncbi:MAG: methyltransferase domain-containing protein [Rhizobiaceae bacterium]|nr:methyltransferase domain-containing protein [Rhizobiaceae bacterium]